MLFIHEASCFECCHDTTALYPKGAFIPMKNPVLLRLSILLPLLGLLPEIQGKTFKAGADNFEDAPVIVDVRSGMSEPTDLSACSVEEGEPPSNFRDGRKTAWWSWTAPASGLCRVEGFVLPGTLSASSLNVTVWQGASLPSLRPAVTRFGTSGPRVQARNRIGGIAFHAIKGETYKIAADMGLYWTVDPFPLRLRLILSPSKRVRTGLWRLVDGDGSTTDIGQVTLAVADNSRFTGKIQMRAGSRSFKGQFDEEGQATVTLKRLATGAGETKLVLDVSGSGAFSLERDGRMTEGELAEQALFANHFPYRFDRTYNCSYAPAPGERTGTGSLYMKITKKGVLKGVGSGLDGSEFTFSSQMVITESNLDVEAPFHLRLRGSKGAVQITLKGFSTEDYPTPKVTGHFFRAPEPKADFYPDGVDLPVTGFGDQTFGTTTHPIVSPIYTQLLSATEGRGVLIVEDAEDGFAPGPVMEMLTLGGGRQGLIKFDRSPLRPVLAGTWKMDTAKGSMSDVTGRRCPILLVRSATDYYSHKMVGLVRGRTRTYRVVIEEPPLPSLP
jgi:hypothetical protein